MSAVPARPHAGPLVAGVTAHRATGAPVMTIWAAWRSLRPREAAVFIVASLMFGAIDLTSLLEYHVGTQLPQVVTRSVLMPLLSGLVLLLCWLPAARSAATGAARMRQLVLATLLGSGLGMVLAQVVTLALPWPSMCDLIRASYGKPPCIPLRPLALMGDTLWVFMPALMIVGLLEIQARRRRQQDAAETLLREHGELRRHALASQLAALQAQVDPPLLFDALVSVEQAYGRRDPSASARLERLIQHLRVALPRLPRHHPTPSGSGGATLASEAELIASYLALLRDLHGQAPAFDGEIGAHAATPLPPMLLLPLVQRALRLGRPGQCWLQAADGRITLGFDQEGLCSEDADLASLRERLAVLGGRLTCASGAGRTLFTLELHA
ncbi:histidine kinase [Roseateles sp.]|uniref:histidine kinase n=1 Tax=Roseateles sp. TaxID=1971397 RepID=UPI003BAB20B2